MEMERKTNTRTMKILEYFLTEFGFCFRQHTKNLSFNPNVVRESFVIEAFKYGKTHRWQNIVKITFLDLAVGCSNSRFEIKNYHTCLFSNFNTDIQKMKIVRAIVITVLSKCKSEKWLTKDSRSVCIPIRILAFTLTRVSWHWQIQK